MYVIITIERFIQVVSIIEELDFFGCCRFFVLVIYYFIHPPAGRVLRPGRGDAGGDAGPGTLHNNICSELILF